MPLFSFKKKEITSGVNDVYELFHASFLPKALIIVTSRPAACKEIRKYAAKRVEVLGFLEKQVIEYIHCHNDKVKAQQLEAHLKAHPNLMNMAYLPLHCAMLVVLFEADSVLPHTESEFYKHFAISTLLRSRIKKNSDDNSEELLDSFDKLPPDEKATFDSICKLAFEATVASKQVFKSSEVEKTLTNADRKTNLVGLVVKDRYFMRYGLDETYTFLHLTFQEYLAAVHLAGLNKPQLLEIIKAHGDSRNLHEVWKFLCGMMDYSKPSTMDAFRDLMRRTKDALLQIRCAYESQDKVPCTHVIDSLHGYVKISNKRLSPSDCVAIGYVLNKHSSDSR